MNLLLSPKSVVLKLAFGAAMFVVIGVIAAYVRIAHGIHFNHLVWLFDLSADPAFPSWYSSVMLLTASALAFVITADPSGHMQSRDRRFWTALGAIFLFLSADEVAGFHEWTGNLAPDLARRMDGAAWGVLYYGWIIFGLMIVAAIGLLFSRFVLRQPPRLRNLLILSGLVFVGGALGIEMINSYIEFNHPDHMLLYMWVTAAEEALEMAGVLIFIYALLDRARARGVQVTVSF